MKRTQVKGMDEFLNLKDDDEVKDEEGAARVREEVTTKEGEGTEAGEAEATEQGQRLAVKKLMLATLLGVSPIRDLELLTVVLQEVGRSLGLFPLPQRSQPLMMIRDLK